MKNPPIALKKNEIAWIGTMFDLKEVGTPRFITYSSVAYTPDGRARLYQTSKSRHQARRWIKRYSNGQFFDRPLIAARGSSLVAFDEYSTPVSFDNLEDAVAAIKASAHASLKLANELYYAKCYEQCYKEINRVNSAYMTLTRVGNAPYYFDFAYELVENEVRRILGTRNQIRYTEYCRELRRRWTADAAELLLSELDKFGPVYRELYNLYTPESDNV